MYWYEKLDLVKKQHGPGAFRDPYRAGPGIIEKILLRLLGCKLMQFAASPDRTEFFRDDALIRLCGTRDIYEWEFPELNEIDWYFLLPVTMPMGPSYAVYDCRLPALQDLVYYSYRGPEHLQEFFIAEKKYAWIMYFRLDHQTKEAVVYKKFAETPRTES